MPRLPRPAPRTTWIEVSRRALANNVAELRRHAPGIPLMAVVKANAYGHGAVPTAEALQAAGADAFATACLSEALELREGGITRPILVLGYTPPRQAAEAAAANITLTVFDLPTAAAYAALTSTVAHAAATASATPPSLPRLTVHVKVNTGMNRLGVHPSAAPELLAALHALPALYVEGIFTHFATSDEADKQFAEQQFAAFTGLLAELAAGGLRPPVAHAANSAALLTMPHTHLDLVRCGIALYGLDPDMHECRLPTGFQPALRWLAEVTHVADLQQGETVSYGREWTAPAQTRIAVIPVGYADGFPRKPHTWGSVLIRGLEAPIVGRVCMDQTVVDITHIEAQTGPLHSGEPVVLIGRQGVADLSAETISARIGTNNYDVVSRILPRVPRLHLD